MPQCVAIRRVCRSHSATRSAQHRPDPGGELPRAERLRDVIVGAHFQAKDAVELLIATREEENRDRRTLAQTPAHLEPVLFRHDDVEHQQVRVFGFA